MLPVQLNLTDALSASEIRKLTTISNEALRKLGLLRVFCLLSILAHLVGIATLGLMAALTGQLPLLLAPVTSLIAIACFLLSYWCSQKNYYRTGCWLVVGSNTLIIAVYAWLLGSEVAVISAFFLPIGMAIILLTSWETALVTAVCCLSCTSQYLSEVYLKLYSPPVKLEPQIQNIPNLVLAAVIVPLIVVLLLIPARSLNQALRLLQLQSQRLQQALEEMELRQHTNQQVSQQVFSLASDLSNTAAQQASNSQQQATALTQVTSSIQQLTSTAQSIAYKTEQLSQAAQEIKASAGRTKAVTQTVIEVGEHGALAVEEMVKTTERVNKIYRELQAVLSDLGQRQSQIKEVVKTIQKISDQTHLLALNASIEAAGAGEYGLRFGVVADEVKSLASHSLGASRQINQILSEVKERIDQAEQTAEKGYQELEKTVSSAQQSGEVLRELVVNIYETCQEVEQIEQAITLSTEQAAEISLATTQHYSISHQILETLQQIGTIASHNASGSAKVTTSTRNLEELSQVLVTG